jgi:15-cis-phytoene synthase
VNAGQFVSRLTRRSRSNFFYAFLCLPRRQRDALYAVYAFCRLVDDAVDLGRDREEQRRELGRWREEIARVYDGVPEHPAAERLQQAIRTFPIPRTALSEIIAGVEMDLEKATY